jgi:hypothetical protein
MSMIHSFGEAGQDKKSQAPVPLVLSGFVPLDKSVTSQLPVFFTTIEWNL